MGIWEDIMDKPNPLRSLPLSSNVHESGQNYLHFLMFNFLIYK